MDELCTLVTALKEHGLTDEEELQFFKLPSAELLNRLVIMRNRPVDFQIKILLAAIPGALA